MTDISGRSAFVTGAGSGIGRALARALSAEGAAVAVADIMSDRAHEVVDEITSAGGKAVPITCDVSDRTSVRRAKAEADAALGPVSLLFANAGVTSWQQLSEMSEDDVDWIYQVNLFGVVDCLKAFLPDMIAAGDGHVVATASVAGLLPAWLPCHSVYSSAKAGVIALMLNLRHELAEHGVGATVFCPSGVATPMGDNNPRARPERFGPGGEVDVPPQVHEIFSTAQRVRRPPEDVVPIVLHAVRNDHPMVINSAQDRRWFEETYADVVTAAFDEAEAFRP